jgi:hypothetical protein
MKPGLNWTEMTVFWLKNLNLYVLGEKIQLGKVNCKDFGFSKKNKFLLVENVDSPKGVVGPSLGVHS